jgi:hypothetical protein
LWPECAAAHALLCVALLPISSLLLWNTQEVRLPWLQPLQLCLCQLPLLSYVCRIWLGQLLSQVDECQYLLLLLQLQACQLSR